MKLMLEKLKRHNANNLAWYETLELRLYANAAVIGIRVEDSQASVCVHVLVHCSVCVCVEIHYGALSEIKKNKYLNKKQN